MNMYDEIGSRKERGKTPVLYKPFDASTLPSRGDIAEKISHNLGIFLFELNAPDLAVRHDAELAIDKLKLQVRKQVNAGDTFVQAGEIYLVVPENIISEHVKDSEYRMRSIHRVEQLTKLLAHNFDIDVAGTFAGKTNGARIVECVKYLCLDAENLELTKRLNAEDTNTVFIAPLVDAFARQTNSKCPSICTAIVSLLSDQVSPELLLAYNTQLTEEFTQIPRL
jgi:hypothetical protein